MFEAIIDLQDPECPPMVVTVFNVRDDKSGYPHFLIYVDNQWRYLSAKYFKPIEEDAE